MEGIYAHVDAANTFDRVGGGGLAVALSLGVLHKDGETKQLGA